MSTPYSEKLKDPRWQKKRLEVMERAGWLCQICGDSDSELHVHHPRYVKGREPWDYENLICACHACHGRIHGTSPRKPYVDPFWKIVARDARNGNRDAHALLSLKAS